MDKDGSDRVKKIVKALKEELDALMDARERIHAKSREIIQLSSRTINAIHMGERGGRVGETDEDVTRSLEELERKVRELLDEAEGAPGIRYGHHVDRALQEYSEAMILDSLTRGKGLPAPGDLGVDARPYLQGLGDVVGELRRYILTKLKEGDVKEAERFFNKMETVCCALFNFHYPKSIVNIRHKKDVARSLLDKTLGEVVVTKGNIAVGEFRESEG